jgi:CrcB protein
MRVHLVVAVGAMIGASARWAVGESLPHETGAFPWSTLIVNLVGCALGGLALRYLVRGSVRWLGAVTGVLGGLTTYSSFALETRDLVDAGRPLPAIVYVAVSIAGGFAAVEAGRSGRVTWRST